MILAPSPPSNCFAPPRRGSDSRPERKPRFRWVDFGDRDFGADYGDRDSEIRDYGDSAFNSHVPVDVVTVPQVSFAAGRHSRYARPYGSEPSTVKAWAKAERDKEK